MIFVSLHTYAMKGTFNSWRARERRMKLVMSVSPTWPAHSMPSIAVMKVKLAWFLASRIRVRQELLLHVFGPINNDSGRHSA